MCSFVCTQGSVSLLVSMVLTMSAAVPECASESRALSPRVVVPNASLRSSLSSMMGYQTPPPHLVTAPQPGLFALPPPPPPPLASLSVNGGRRIFFFFSPPPSRSGPLYCPVQAAVWMISSCLVLLRLPGYLHVLCTGVGD